MKQFEDIWEEYYPKLTVYLRTSFHFSETDDLVQDIMMKVYSNINKYRPSTSFNTWIYSIARNHAIDQLRRNTTQNNMLERVRSDAAVSSQAAVNTETRVLRKELKSDIALFIDSLPDNERQVSFLKYYEELGYRDISRITGIPVGTIKYHIHNVKRKFSDYYGENYED